MKLRISHTLAALLVAGAVPLAHSQSPQPPAGLVDEPVASVSRSDEMANAIAQALNADASLKHSKITVQPDEGTILLTGSTLSEVQKLQASRIAMQHAGEDKVVNTLAHDELVVVIPPSELAPQDQEQDQVATTTQTPPAT